MEKTKIMIYSKQNEPNINISPKGNRIEQALIKYVYVFNQCIDHNTIL